MKMFIFFTSIIFFATFNQSEAQESPINRESISLTVYNSDLGVVKDTRSLNLKKGVSEISLNDISAQIDPTTVKISSPKHPRAVAVREQNYRFDLADQETLLQKYIDHPITYSDDQKNMIEGTLLSSDGKKLTILTSKGINMVTLGAGQVTVPSLPNELITRPTLVWQLESQQQLNNEPVEISYQTSGLTWHAEYIAALANNDSSIDLSGWVSIENKSGMSYPDAHLKVVAGNVNRVESLFSKRRERDRMFYSLPTSDKDFEERRMFEYHLYDLGRQTTIANNEIKQISLLNKTGIRAEKHYSYTGGSSVGVSLTFKNDEANNLGLPLPEGVVRVMKADKDGALEFVGEDRLAHTPKDENVIINVGKAFDLVGEQELTNYQKLANKSYKRSFKVTLKNHKEEAVAIDVIEQLSGDWIITESSMEYVKKNAGTFVFHLILKPHTTESITYTTIADR